MIDKSTDKYPKRYIYEDVEGGVSIGVTDDEDSYITKRIDAYPPIGDQLDALWKGGEALEQMRQQITAVKDKYPKELLNDTN